MVSVAAQNATGWVPTKYGVIVFPGFQNLDVNGPLDVLNFVSLKREISIAVIAETMSPVHTNPGPKFSVSKFGIGITPTHTFETAPSDLEVLIVPGGLGTRTPEIIAPAEAYIKKAAPNLKYIITICTGSALLARTGLLDGRRATTNKRSWAWATSQGPKVNWVAEARWVADEPQSQLPIWSSSGVSAGIDALFAFVKEHYGEEVATEGADGLEYERHLDASWDPFAKLWGLVKD